MPLSVLLLGLRVSCVLEVCGAFGGRVLGEDFAAGVGDGFVSSRSDLSEQGLKLGEDLLDRIEIGRVFRQEYKARPDVADRLPHRFSLVRAEIIEDHDVARLEGRDEKLLDIGAKALAIDRSVEQAGRIRSAFSEGPRSPPPAHRTRASSRRRRICRCGGCRSPRRSRGRGSAHLRHRPWSSTRT
jgi:hypothetical protein